MRRIRSQHLNRPFSTLSAEGLSLKRDSRGLTLDLINESGAHQLGTFANAVEAWRALDALDCAALERAAA
jgi:hypothetical protein